MLNSLTRFGSLTGVSWSQLRTQCDPYLIWFAFTYQPRQTEDVLVDLLVELRGNTDSQRNADIEWLREKAEFVVRIQMINPYAFITGTIAVSKVHLLVADVGGTTGHVKRFELATPRYIPPGYGQKHAKLAEFLAKQSTSVKNNLQSDIDQQASAAKKKESQKPPSTAAPSAAAAPPPREARPRCPLVVVVDDFCNFNALHLRGRIRSVWHQGLDGRRRTHLPEDGFDPWLPQQPLDPSFADGKHDHQYEVGECLDASTLAGRECYGAIMNLDNKVVADGLTLVDETTAYQKANYGEAALRWTHGSAVLHAVAGDCSSAPGADPDGSLALPAPDDIHFVQLPGAAVLDTSGGSLAGYALDAIHRAARRAAHECRPSVIVNLSYGTQSGPHDGSSMFEGALLELLDRYDGQARYPGARRTPALHVVLPAGNTHLWRCHACAWVPPTPTGGSGHTLHWKILPDAETDSFVELWFDDGAAFEITLTAPGGQWLGTVKKGEIKTWEEAGAPGRSAAGTSVLRAAVIYPDTTSRGTCGTMALIALAPTQRRANYGAGEAARTPWSKLLVDQDGNLEDQIPRVPLEAPPGVWKIELRNAGRATAGFHAWVQRDDAAPGRARSSKGYRGRQSHLLDGEGSGVDPRFTLNGIATAVDPNERLWVVGAMDENGQLSRYSAAGPGPNTPELCEGPDVVTTVDRSRNHPGRLVGGVWSGSRVRLAGTSIGAAVFTRMLHHALSQCGPDWKFHPLPQPCPPQQEPVAGEPELARDVHRGWWAQLRFAHDLVLPRKP